MEILLKLCNFNKILAEPCLFSINMSGKVLWAPGGLTVLGLHLSWQWARATPLTPSTDRTMLWLRVQGEIRVTDLPSVELSHGAGVARLAIFSWHIVLSSTILREGKAWF